MENGFTSGRYRQTVTAAVEVRPVGPDEVEALGTLFASARTARHCWCMSFCSRPAHFAVGWFGGGNRRRFQTMVEGGVPMGVLASVADGPVGWAACGPRLRYLGGGSSGPLLKGRPRTEDGDVWLLPCLFVHPDHRGTGISHLLVEGAAQLAQGLGAVALEGWPVARGAKRQADAFAGREEMFAGLGFGRAAQPRGGRVVVRRNLVPDEDAG